jgi:alkaline phosphatase
MIEMTIYKKAKTIFAYLFIFSAQPGCQHIDHTLWDTETDTHQGADTNTGEDAGDDAGDEQFWDAPENVVLFIGDGMGPAHIAAAGMYENGAAGTLFFESFPVHGLVNVASASSEIPDSAACATAVACGEKVNNSVVASALPGDGRELTCLVDIYKEQRKSVGLVTTVYVTHATPAAFAAHAQTRSDVSTIAWHYLNTGRPEILFGGGGYGMEEEAVEAAGYEVIHSLDDPVLTVDAGETVPMIAGLFGEGFYPYEATGLTDRPHLYETAAAAVELLSGDPDGFFVMIEGGMIDQASHINRLDLALGEMAAFEQAVRDVTDIVDLDETLILVTADHATGDLQIEKNNGEGELPDVSWGSRGHTGEPVDLFAAGKGADAFKRRFDSRNGVIDNTEIFKVLTQKSPPRDKKK